MATDNFFKRDLTPHEYAMMRANALTRELFVPVPQSSPAPAHIRAACNINSAPFEGMRAHNMFAMYSLTGDQTPIWLPNPDYDSAENLIATLVNSGRNTLAVVTAQKIGRDQEKTSMTWSYLSKKEWEEMLRFWDQNFFFNFTYYSRVEGRRITRKFYINDRKDKPYDIDQWGIPTAYKDCSANVIDTGEGA